MTGPSNSPRVRLLGPVSVTGPEGDRVVGGVRRKALLAALAVQAGQVVGADRLIELMWGGDAPATAVNTLHSHISFLRRAFGLRDVIVAQPGGYLFDAPEAVDAHVAQQLVREAGRPSNPREAVVQLRQALGLWRGRSLADIRDLPWFQGQAEHWDQVRLGAVRGLAELLLAQGRHEEVLVELAEPVGSHPFDEDLHRLLMLALYRAGRAPEALTLFRELQARLRAELGVDPEPGLCELADAVQRRDGSLLLRSAAEPAAVAVDLVERGEQTRLVAEVLADTRGRRHGRVVLVAGQVGLGKTALLHNGRAVAQGLGYTVLSVRGMELEQDHAWGGVRRMFERVSALPEPSEGSEYPYLEALYWLAHDLAAAGPLLCVIDDCQWLDALSARFVAYLAARLDGLPVVLLVATHPGAPRLDAVLPALSGDVVLDLAPLSPAGTASLLADPDPDTAAQAYEVTGGNPFLVRELGRELAAGRDLPEVLANGAPGVARHVAQQLRRLGPQARQVAQALAVLGGQSTLESVCAVAELEPQQALSGLARLREVGFLCGMSLPEGYSLAHDLTVQAVRQGLDPAGLAEAHLRAARDALRGSHVIEAAAHLLHVPAGYAGPEAPAILARAAYLCSAQGSADQAVAFLRRRLAEDLGDARLAALTSLGMAEVLVDTAQACEHLAAALAEQPDPEARAEIALQLAGALLFAGRSAEAIGVCRSLLAEQAGLSLSAQRALQACVVNLAMATRQNRFVAHVVERYAALPFDESVGGLLLEGSLSLHDALANRREAAVLRASRAVAGHRLSGVPGAEGALASAWVSLGVADSPDALASIDHALAEARGSGSLRALGNAACFRAAVLLGRGQVADAIDDARVAWSAAVATTALTSLPLAANTLMLALVAAGRTSEARSAAEQTRALCPADIPYRLWADGEITVLAELGRDAEAFDRVLLARADCLSFGLLTPLYCDWRGHLVHLLTRQRRQDEAREVAQDLTRVAAEWGTPRAVGRALRLAALPEAGESKVDLLYEAVRVLEGSPALLELALARQALGEALHDTGWLPDSRAQSQAARDLAELCGAAPLVRRAEQALRRSGVRPRRGTLTGPAALTPAETRVAELAAQRLSNRDIAARLDLTVKTVEVHLSSAFRKLGIGRRQELAGVLGSGAR